MTPTSRKIALYICSILSAISLLFGLILVGFGYSTVKSVISGQLSILPDHPRSYDNWKTIPLPIYNHFYLFNITNVDAVLAQTEKIRVQEVGPFVYIEHRHKVNITYSEDETEVEYEQIRVLQFAPELTTGSLDDVIYHLNVPLASAAGYVSKQVPDARPFFYEAINDLLADANSTIFASHLVRELLFEGYADELITEASLIFPEQASIDKFGWFYKRNDTAPDGVYRIQTGADDISKIGKMVAWKNESEIGFTGSCAVISDTTPGDFLPPFEEQTLPYVKLFVGDLCRPIKLNFDSVVDIDGVDAHRYSASKDTFDYSLPENQCFCPEDGCPVSGVANVSVCQLGAPAFISLPHFLYADHTYLQAIDGLNPNAENHEFRMDLFPNLGVAVDLKVAMQINIMLVRDVNIKVLSNMTMEQILIPQIWFYATADADSGTRGQLKLVQYIPTIILWAAIALILIGAISGLVIVLTQRRLGKLVTSTSQERLNDPQYPEYSNGAKRDSVE
ncbi:Protein croquemort [Halotydeus destructor]|nr:Protein croquemort [Halotydeus destructor]